MIAGSHVRTTSKVRRPFRSRSAVVLCSTVVLLTATTVDTFASVSTDGYFFNAGDTVPIRGDGMAAGESVRVDVVNPGGTLAQEHFVAADAGGNFADTYTLPADAADGIYGVLAVGQQSHQIFRTTFDPSVQADCLQFTSGGADPTHTAVTPTATSVATGIQVSWYDSCTDEDNFVVQRRATSSDPWSTIPGAITSGVHHSTETLLYLDKSTACGGNTYQYQVVATRSDPKYTSFSNPSLPATTTACSSPTPTGGPATTTISTTPYSDSADTVTTPFGLGSTVHDSATLTASDGSTPQGTVSFDFYVGSTCADQAGTEVPGMSESPSVPTTGTIDSANVTAPLHAGSYYYLVSFASADKTMWSNAGPECEDVTVNKADPVLTTEVHVGATDDPDHGPTIVSTTSEPLGTTVHDSAQVNPATDATGFTPDGTVSFTFFGSNTEGNSNTGDCTDPQAHAAGGPTLPDANGLVDPSTLEGPLHRGGFAFVATFTPSADDTDYNTVDSPCEPFTIAPATPTVSTAVHLGANDSNGTSVVTSSLPLGSTVHDSATVSPTVSGFPATGTVAFTFFGSNTNPNQNTGDCTDTTHNSAGSGGVGDGSESLDPSMPEAGLHHGGYAFQATFTPTDTKGGDYTAATSACEPFSVDMAATSTTTTLATDSNGTLSGNFAIAGSVIHDTAQTTSTNTSFSVGDNNPTTSFAFYKNATCTGTASSTSPPEPVDGNGKATEETTHKLDVGSYCWNATYTGNGDYAASTAPNEPLTVLPHGTVTDSSLCTFDTDGNAKNGRQFDLVYTPDTTGSGYKLNASNPGQFYYNVFSLGNAARSVTITIPGPFVTQGAVPVHVYSGVSLSSTGPLCFTPGTDITSGSSVQGAPYTTTSGGQITVNVPATPDGFAYINVHLDYGFKGADPCTATATGGATCGTQTIAQGTAYPFSSSEDSTGDTVYNNNVFKKDPGIGGLVTHKTDSNPVSGSPVSIYDSSNHLLTTATTDSDGWFMWSYKYTGKAASFVVKNGTQSQTVTLKANGFLVVAFSV